MFKAPEIMRMAQNLARHAGARQSVIAANIANADTPGYRARDIASFSETYEQTARGLEARRTRPGHLAAASRDPSWRVIDAGGQPSPNGNTVSLEEELVRATRAESSHALALSVYGTSLDILRTAIGRGR